MKLADDALIAIIEYLRQALLEEKDISDLLRQMELEPNSEGRLGIKREPGTEAEWIVGG